MYVQQLCQVDEKYAMLFNIGIATGLRVGDILRLRVKDIKKMLKVTESKTKKTKNVKLHPIMYETAQEYIKDSKLEGHHAFIPSRPSAKEKPLSRIQAYRIMRRTASKMAQNCIGTHSMRKTYAHTIYAQTRQISAVRKALGHTSIETTMRYLVNDLDKLLENAIL